MKFPSLLRTPKHQRFHITPRYYDPVKEELKQRIARIKNQVDNESQEKPQYASRIRGTFGRGRKHSKTSRAEASQLLLVLVLAGGFVGYLYFGNIALYLLAAVLVLYYYLKLKRIL